MPSDAEQPNRKVSTLRWTLIGAGTAGATALAFISSSAGGAVVVGTGVLVALHAITSRKSDD
jgi:hypothetical protein